MEYKSANITAVDGGFIVEFDGEKIQVVTSLNKAIKLVRDYIGGSAEAEDKE